MVENDHKPMANKTGLPENLKSVMEYLSGMDLSDVKVHYNSSNPLQFHARAYAQGNNIYLGPRQEQLLPHELWHVVQQKQGRVIPTTYVERMAINVDPVLEKEAIMMGAAALKMIVRLGSTIINSADRPVWYPSFPLKLAMPLPVIQFDLNAAIKYLRAKGIIAKNETVDGQRIQNYLDDTDNDFNTRRELLQEYLKPPSVEIPEDLQVFFPNLSRPLIDNNQAQNWMEVSDQVRNFIDNPVAMGAGGVVPNVDLQTRVRGIDQAIITQLNPSLTSKGDKNVDVKSTAYPNQPHTHQNMAAWSQLSAKDSGDDTTRQNAARNVMRVVKRTVIDDGKEGKELIRVAKNDAENDKAWNAAIAFATELTTAEAYYGGTEALANAMANLYAIRHGYDRNWSTSFYGTGTGGAGNLARLSASQKNIRDRALNQAYREIAEHLSEIYETKKANSELKDQTETFDKWVERKFQQWVKAYDSTFSAEHEVTAIIERKHEIDESKKRYGNTTGISKSKKPVGKSKRKRAPSNSGRKKARR